MKYNTFFLLFTIGITLLISYLEYLSNGAFLPGKTIYPFMILVVSFASASLIHLKQNLEIYQKIGVPYEFTNTLEAISNTWKWFISFFISYIILASCLLIFDNFFMQLFLNVVTIGLYIACTFIMYDTHKSTKTLYNWIMATDELRKISNGD